MLRRALRWPCRCWVVALLVAVSAAQAQAQSEAEQARLQALLQESPPSGMNATQWRKWLDERVGAAVRLGDQVRERELLQLATERDPTNARWFNDLANVETTLGRNAEAEKLVRQAIALAKSPVQQYFYEMRLWEFTSLGPLEAARGRVREALDRGPALLAGSTAAGDRILVQRSMVGLQSALARIELRLGRLNDRLVALRAAEAAATAALAEADRAQIATAVTASQLGVIQKSIVGALTDMDRLDEAAAQLQAHERFVAERHMPVSWQIGAHRVHAELAMAQRDAASAEKHLRAALAVNAGLNRPLVRSTVEMTAQLAVTLWAQSRAAEAVPLLAALDARLATQPGLKDAASLPFERGLVQLATGQADSAVGRFKSVTETQLKLRGEGHYYQAQAEGLLGVAQWRSGKPELREQALDHLRNGSVRLLSPTHPNVQLNRGLRPQLRELIFATYVEAAAARGGLQAILAMGAADRLRSGLTAEAMAAAALRAASTDDTLRDLVREDQDAQRELNVLQEQLAGQDGGALADDGREAARKRLVALEQRRTELRVLIRGRYPNYDQLASPPVADTSGVAQRLAGDEALVFMLPLAQETVIWSVTANELPVVARAPIGRDGLAALSAQLRRSVTFGNGPLPPFDRRAAAELYQRLITPVEGSLAAVKHLIVVASGPLGSVPFPALLRNDPADTGRSSWLLDRWTVTQMPTVGAWLTLRSLPPSPAAPEPLIGWGDPAFALGHAPQSARPTPISRSAMRYGDLATLPESRDELQGIAASLKADAARDLVLGPAATRDSVLAASRAGTLARKRVVVFATHGLGRDDLPGLDQPALAMAATPGDASLLAPLLKLDDVLSLRLNAEWVVLSACNTAAGDGRDDEALTGLARGFLYAGTRTLLATHWAVETESAKRLTTALFEHWAAHPTARKAESHRQAMQALAATPRYAHPAYWAPYVLIGEGRR